METYESARKMARLLTIVSSTKDMRARSDLMKMYQNCKKIYLELDKESVECRRLKRNTIRFTELEQKLNESINEFEQWISYAALLYS
jgi:translation initiation factor 2B subunit (eIF-2B alpha/beta/delta family)